MYVLFIIKNDLSRVYVTTTDNYSKVLKRLGIKPERCVSWRVGQEFLNLLAENQIEHFMREH